MIRLITAILLLTFAREAYGEGAALTFEKDVLPILKAHSMLCHGEEEKPKAGVDLRLRRFMDAPLENGATLLVPGNPAASELVAIIERGPLKGQALKRNYKDVWKGFHLFEGQVHCGSNVARTPLADWWKELQKP